MFARFDENPSMTLRVIKETKRYGRTDARTDARMDNVKTVYPYKQSLALTFLSCLAYMNMFARFDENPAMTLRVIKEKALY